MDVPPNPPAYGYPATPPTQPGALPAAPAAWPTVIGVISLVLGILGTLTHICGVLGAVLVKGMGSFFGGMMAGAGGSGSQASAQQAQVQTMFDAMGAWMIPLALAEAAALACAVYLIVCGAWLLKRRRAGAAHHTWWAIARLVFALISVIVNVLYQLDLYNHMQAAAAAGGNGGSGSTSPAMGMMSPVFTVIMAIPGLLIVAAYPVFVLIWFRRASVRALAGTWAR